VSKYPKRLIEVDLPIKRMSAHARREKSIPHGHISTLHIWWARRPLATRRAFKDLKAIYRAAGAEDRCRLVVGDGGHRFYARKAWAEMLKQLP